MKPKCSEKLNSIVAAGVINSSPRPGDIEGPLEIVFAGLLGAMGGFVVGLLIGILTRIFTMNAANGERGGIHWAAYGASAGALCLAIVEFFN